MAHKVKVTVLKKFDMRDLWGDENPGARSDFPPICDLFEVGDEFVIEPGQLPAGFCAGAYGDLLRYIGGLQRGANYDWMARSGEVVACCTDAFRPVAFKIERLAE